ncbi:hypothetical protein [Halioxenophilus sp. WMMB6]|uniref:hypothetical protein n=1 Tax=Halioxenophilus sp. WMMB6 TaxID=3073815 RepID=UPI00295EA4D0|nr:hypothetical protein [Halioxenophilus sp. WMMB6]
MSTEPNTSAADTQISETPISDSPASEALAVEAPTTESAPAAEALPDIQLHHSANITPPAAPQVRIELPRVLDLGCGILARLVLQAPKEKSKALFKRLKAGEVISLGNLTLGEQVKIQLKLLLDHRAYEGPGFNSEVFRASVDQLIHKIAPRLRARQDLSIRSDNQGSVLFDIPAGVRVKGHLNVMMVVLDLQIPGEITMRLSYFEPSQFQVKE